MKQYVVGKEVVQWVARRTGEFGNYGSSIGIGIEENNELIAGVVFNDYNGININMHVASDNTKNWMTREFLWMVFDYAFNQAKVQRITGLVGENNWHARKFDEHIGFTLETTLDRAHPDGRMLIYRMFREDCKWLNIRRQRESLQDKRMAMVA